MRLFRNGIFLVALVRLLNAASPTNYYIPYHAFEYMSNMFTIDKHEHFFRKAA